MAQAGPNFISKLKNKIHSPNPRADAAAGLSLAAMNVPQLMGYAKLAGMPVAAGLYTALAPVAAFALFGASRHLVVAADSATAVIFSSIASAIAPVGEARFIALAGFTALMTAAFLFLARIFKLGFLGDFLSRTVLVGFLTGVGLQVAIAMAGGLLGLRTTSRQSLGQLWRILQGVDAISLPTALLSCIVIGLLFIGKRFAPKAPVALIVVAGSIAASAAFDFSAHGVETLGPMAGGLPKLSIPIVSWNDAMALVPAAISCFIMIIAQSASTVSAFAARFKEQDDLNSDILGLAAANLAAGFSGAFVVNGSPTQTSMAAAAGARSQLAQLVFAGAVMIVLLFLTAPLQYLPSCVLSAIVFTIAVGMIDMKSIRSIHAESWGEARLTVLTAAMVVFIGVEQGILLAVALSLLRHVRHSYTPYAAIYREQDGKAIYAKAAPGEQTRPGWIVYWFSADLFYANINRFLRQARDLIAHAPDRVKYFVIDAHSMTTIDYSAAVALRDFIAEMREQGMEIVFCDAAPSLLADLSRHKIAVAKPNLSAQELLGAHAS